MRNIDRLLAEAKARHTKPSIALTYADGTQRTRGTLHALLEVMEGGQVVDAQLHDPAAEDEKSPGSLVYALINVLLDDPLNIL